MSEWKLVGCGGPIADTGDYDGHWEISNGKVLLLSDDDDDEPLQAVVDALNKGGVTIRLDDSNEFVLWHEKEELIEQLERTRAALSEAQTALGERDREINDMREAMTELEFAKLSGNPSFVAGWKHAFGALRARLHENAYKALNPADTAEPVMEDVKL